MRKEYNDEYTRFLAIEVTDLMIYADKDLALALYDFDINIDRNLKADEDGSFCFNELVKGPHAVFNFKLDDSYANKKAVKEFESNNDMY